VKVVDTF